MYTAIITRLQKDFKRLIYRNEVLCRFFLDITTNKSSHNKNIHAQFSDLMHKTN
jgi:hypothetical protein